MRFSLKEKLNVFGHIYAEARLDKTTQKELNCILGSNTCGTICGLICASGTTAMVGLATLLGANDFLLGLLVSIPQVAAFFQIPFASIINRYGHRKLFQLLFGITGRSFWLVFGFLPLLQRGGTSNFPLTLLIILLSLSSILCSMISVCWMPWFSALAPLSIRGRWFSIRDAIVSVASVLCGFLISYLLDSLPVPVNFIVVFLFGGILGVVDMLFYVPIRDVPIPVAKHKPMQAEVFSVFQNKPFMRFTLMWTLRCFAANMSGSYLTPYSMNVMGLNNTQMMLFGTIVASLATIFAVPKWGRCIDRFGSKNVMTVCSITDSATQLIFLFSSPGNVLPVLFYNLIGASFWCGSNLAANSQQLFASPEEGRSTYLAVYACIASILGTALGTMCGGWFLTFCTSRHLFEGSIDRYQILIIIAVVIRVITTVLMVPKLSNENEETCGNLLQFLFRVLNPKRLFHR